MITILRLFLDLEASLLIVACLCSVHAYARSRGGFQ
jgi:hypothetical protein